MRTKRSEDYYIKILLEQTKVKDIMTTSVIKLREDVPFSQVEEKLRAHGIRHLPIVDDKNFVVGIITQRDLYRIISPRRLDDGGWYYDKEMLNEIILARVMTLCPKVVRPEDSVGQALLLMVKGKIGCLPVVDGQQKLCGIITQVDLLKAAAEILQGK